MRRIIVAITGASGAVYGVRLLHALRAAADVETHLLVTPAGVLNLKQELDLARGDVERLADVVHNVRDIGATIASGSFVTHGMVVAPCSMKTLAAVAHGLSDNLVTRAADVVLKERRRLVLVPRETPLHEGHCRLMHEASRMGAIIAPPMPAFYTAPQSVDDIVNHTVGRLLDLFGIDSGLVRRWQGARGRPRSAAKRPR